MACKASYSERPLKSILNSGPAPFFADKALALYFLLQLAQMFASSARCVYSVVLDVCSTDNEERVAGLVFVLDRAMCAYVRAGTLRLRPSGYPSHSHCHQGELECSTKRLGSQEPQRSIETGCLSQGSPFSWEIQKSKLPIFIVFMDSWAHLNNRAHWRAKGVCFRRDPLGDTAQTCLSAAVRL